MVLDRKKLEQQEMEIERVRIAEDKANNTARNS